MVKEGGRFVIDVGMNSCLPIPSVDRGYRLVGDCDYDSVAEKASWITPGFPGGVGPMTVSYAHEKKKKYPLLAA